MKTFFNSESSEALPLNFFDADSDGFLYSCSSKKSQHFLAVLSLADEHIDSSGS